MSDIAKQTAQRKVADKLDRSSTSGTTRTSLNPSEFTFSTTPESDDTLVIESTAAPLRIKKKTKSNVVPAGPFVPEVGSSAWLQSGNLWDPELDEKFAHEVEAEKQKTRKSKKSSRLTSEGDSKPPSSKHIRKTLRKSQSERSVTRLSPASNHSTDHELSPREAFRAFLLQDRITQSQRDITKPPLAQTDRITQSQREITKPPLAEQTGKRKKKRSKSTNSKREHSTGSSRALGKQPTPLSDVSASRSRLLNKKQLSMSKIDTSHAQLPEAVTITPSPSLHSVFEWTRSPTSNEESKDPGSRLKSLHPTPSSQGLMDRRELMRKARSTSDVYQYHVTPEWPSRKRNAKLHSLFYDLSVRRQTIEKDSAGIPLISAKEMLNIMEPCSRREILTAQGKELEPPLYREDLVLNYGDVIDGISLTSTQATKSN
jgi:hypothetical protein